MSAEPPTKKQRNIDDWEKHTLNISEAIMKGAEGHSFTEIADSEIQTLQGIGPKAAEVLKTLGLEKVRDLAEYKFFLFARAAKVLAAVEETRVAGSVMNIDKAVDKAFETKTLKELLEAPLSALQGLTTKADDVLKSLGVKSVGDLADFKYAQWAEAIVAMGKFEELKTKDERHKERELNKLA